MSEETLKVNEFEYGADDEGVCTHNETFQQIYGEEANLVYRAESAEVILNNPEALRAMIQHHMEYQCKRLATLDNYTKARNDTIMRDKCRRSEDGKADHRVAHNFAKVINIFDVGYNTGIPIKKASDLDEVNEIIREYDQRNDIAALDTELWRDFKKYGRAYELQYRNQQDEDRSVISSVFETFVCYNLDVERKPLFAVRYPRYKVGSTERTTVYVYTNQEVIKYKSCGLETMQLVEESRTQHSWGEVPITEYSPNRDRMGGFEDVLPLIDLYDAAQSDTANYMTDLNEALLVISGNLDTAKLSVADAVAMKKANLLILENGINPDGSTSQTSAGYIHKEYDATGTEAYKSRLRMDIHSTSLIPDLADSAFAGTQSGEAMKYKLFGFQQVTKTAQNGFKEGLKRRYRLLLNIKSSVQEATNADLGNFTVTFTPNLPRAVLEELKALATAGAEFSQETLLELASFVEDAQTELERLQAERETAQNDVVMNYTFAGNEESSEGEPEDVTNGERID